MPTEDLRERLTASALKARGGVLPFPAGRADRRGPPGPGDLFVLAATGELPVEWAVLDRRPGRPGRGGELLVVPADAHPAAGSADVEVPAGAAGGPLSLRCGFGAWLDAGLFAAATRSGSLAPGTVAEALQRRRRVEAGTLESSPLAEEVDADPEYEDWIREVPERARALVLAPRRTEARPSRLREAYALAAMFALVAIGLSVWVIQLRREVNVLSVPIFDVPGQEVNLGEQSRGSRTVLKVPRDAKEVILLLVLDPAFPDQVGRFEITDATGRVLRQGPLMHLLPSGEFRVFVPRSFLPDGEYHVRTVPSAGGSSSVESILDVVSGN